MTGQALVRSYWPRWVAWSVGLCAALGPLLLAALARIDIAYGITLAGMPLFVAQLLYAPYDDEWDPETGLLTSRTRERWVRAWRRALVAVAILVPVLGALWWGIMALDLP